MRIQINVTMDVNPDEWAEEYGVERGEVRGDVKRWAADRLNQYSDGSARVVAVR